MKRRFTKVNIAKILDNWPQAVNADCDDLRVLHDLANAGAQMWGERLRWPDYLWLGLDRAACSFDNSRIERYGILVQSPQVSAPDADLGIINKMTVYPTGTGCYQLADRIDCILEMKAISADHVPKLRNFTPDIPWTVYLEKKLHNAFWRHLEQGDKQIHDCRRIMGLSGARGVTILINDGSPSLNPEMVGAFLVKTIKQLPDTDAIVYLSDRPIEPKIAFIPKDPHDEVLARFTEEFFMMLRLVDWTCRSPVIRGGPYPQLAIRIEMDEQSRAMCRNWATGWRRADDPSPVSRPTYQIQIVPREEFKSGLR